jgi:hypothetical protein
MTCIHLLLLVYTVLSITILIQFFPFLKCVYIFWCPLYTVSPLLVDRVNVRHQENRSIFVLEISIIIFGLKNKAYR